MIGYVHQYQPIWLPTTIFMGIINFSLSHTHMHKRKYTEVNADITGNITSYFWGISTFCRYFPSATTQKKLKRKDDNNIVIE